MSRPTFPDRVPRAAGRKWRWLVAVTLLAALLRAWAVVGLPVDYDEPTYLGAGYDYAAAIRAGDWDAVIDYDQNREHPALPKLIYAGVVLALGEDASYARVLAAGRAISAAFGTLAALLLALLDPLAGGLLAVHTIAVKYTSQVYLEALPALASLAAVLALLRAAAPRDRWFWLSALLLGVTAAGKFTYLVVLFPIAYLVLWGKPWGGRNRRLLSGLGNLALYGLVAVLTFWALDPALWHDPLGRLWGMFSFHAAYSQGARVEAAGLPWYQPIIWLSSAAPVAWHPNVFFYFGLDGLYFWLTLGGLRREWRQRRWVVVWLAAAVALLLLWPTKWPQYTLIVAPAFCLTAAATVRDLRAWALENDHYWGWLRESTPRLGPAAWVVAGLIGAALLGSFALDRIDIASGQRGWSHVAATATSLPGDTVYDLVRDASGRMIAGTDRGVAIWTPGAAQDGGGTWVVHRSGSSGLADDQVRAVLGDPAGADVLWCGTAGGLSRFDGAAWQTFRGRDLGLAADAITALARDPRGRLWVGTQAGAAVFDGQRWQAFTAPAGPADNFISGIAADGDTVWFGTRAGVSALDTRTARWQTFTTANSGLASDNIGDVAVDAAGVLWVATLGGGLSAWDGATWQTYLSSSSDLPLNAVQVVAEVQPGVLWIGTNFGSVPGGLITVRDGGRWQTYFPGKTGFTGGEPLALAADGLGRVWIGTRGAGIDIFDRREQGAK